MVFFHVVNSLIELEFDVGSLVFSDVLGFSKRSAKKYVETPMAVGSRGFSQFSNRLLFQSENSKDELTRVLSTELLNIFNSVRDESENIFPSPKEFYVQGILSECEKLNVSAENIEIKDIPFHYSMSFYCDISLPYRSYDPIVSSEKLLYSTFPYNTYGEKNIDYFLIQYEKEGGVQKDDIRSVELIIDSIIGVIAAIYLDIKKQNKILLGRGMEFWPGFFKGAWEANNAKAYFFVHIREESKETTYEQFYRDLASEIFTNLDLESVKTNYKRWCRTGSVREEQWRLLAGTGDVLSDEYVLLRFKFSIAILFIILKDVTAEAEIAFTLDEFKVELNRWCDLIEEQYPLESWQSFLTAD